LKYKHVTIKHSMEGLSPLRIISELGKEGYSALHSSLARTFCNFLELKDPFKTYKKIAYAKESVDSTDFRVLDYYYVQRYYTDRPDRSSGQVLFSSFGDFFKHRKDPEITFLLYEHPSSIAEKTIWFCCWTEKEIELDEPLERFIITFFKVIGCEKPLEEIAFSDTFSRTHSKMIEELKEYNLNKASFREKKSSLEVLSDEQVRTLLIELNKKGNVLLSDFLAKYRGKEKERKKKILRFLTGQKFLTKELIIICKKTGQWWNVTIPSREKMKEIEDLGITCTTCGAKVSEERVDEFYRISNKGKRLVSGSCWMVGQIVRDLVKNGVRDEDIFVNVTYNGEEIDIMAFYLARIIVLELKDREFGLGDAYRYHGKISRLIEKAHGRRDVYPIVVTTETVASEARRLLHEVVKNETKYVFVEGLESFNSVFRDVLNKITLEIISNEMRIVRNKFPGTLLTSADPLSYTGW